jgi:lysophospholipase L1-like esterase
MKKKHRVLMALSLLANAAFIALAVYLFASGRHLRLAYPHLTTEYRERMDLFRAMPAHRTRAVFLGDSITYRCEWAELFGDRNIVNRGINGDGLAGMCERAGEIARLHPAGIFILGGLNDLGMKRDPDDILKDYRRLLDRLRALSPRSRIYVQSILPVIPSRVKVEPAAIDRMNRGLEALAKGEGAAFIDLHDSFSDRDGNLQAGLTHDGVHLNGAGYLRWKSCIEKYLP